MSRTCTPKYPTIHSKIEHCSGFHSAAAAESGNLRSYRGTRTKISRHFLDDNPHCAQLFSPEILSRIERLGIDVFTPKQLSELQDSILDYSSRLEFFDRSPSARTCIHFGQLKLLLAEIRLLLEVEAAMTLNAHSEVPSVRSLRSGHGACSLTRCAAKSERRSDFASEQALSSHPIIVYVGAADGNHLIPLMKLFPMYEYHLYDPRPFCRRLTHDKQYAAASYTLFEREFTLEDAQRYAGVDTILISDLRTGLHEHCVDEDMELQRQIVITMMPRISLLKFRLPWDDGETEYFDGRIMIQAYATTTTTETRLLVTDPTKMKVYNNKKYEEQLAYHNCITRASPYDTGIERRAARVIGLDSCYDCATLVKLIDDYYAICGTERAAALYTREPHVREPTQQQDLAVQDPAAQQDLATVVIDTKNMERSQRIGAFINAVIADFELSRRTIGRESNKSSTNRRGGFVGTSPVLR
jgi:hypothetical protein